ncbi:FGGY family carbohydrate kinase [Rathayibacter sp. KR2-224]|uniref:FGGY family carbohydrate kinase n=1 Tax=Rathayibacter sp. KR2-224 TaxID=3400913 RepID=UPI003C05E4E7
MPDSPVIVAVDQGTSSTKCVVVDSERRVLGVDTVPISQQHPRPGWVEQDAAEILRSVLTVLRRARDAYGSRICAVGLSTQRESALVWERATGRSVGPVLGWQDRRTSGVVQRLIADGISADVAARTGLPLDPMFSAPKLEWLLDQSDPDRRLSRAGHLAVGTVDSWLAYNLTGEHVIETGNASRTLLLDIDRVAWDADLLEIFNIPEQALPELIASDADRAGRGGDAPLAAVLADSHAALYGHGVRAQGAAKATYGTGSSVMGLVGEGQYVPSSLARTIAWTIQGKTMRAFEGNILSTGATLVWLADLLQTTPAELLEIAAGAPVLHGIDLVPAFAGLAAPWWDASAVGTLSGFTLGTDRAALARAAADSIALQVEDVLAACEAGGLRIGSVLLDGGPSANDWLVQLQADLSQRVVQRSRVAELSAYGAALLAGATRGLWDPDLGGLQSGDTFVPRLDSVTAEERRRSWAAAVASARGSAADRRGQTSETTSSREYKHVE